ncbi:MAG: AmmeMemoRadiSam system protein B [Myxococcota bacterium]
MASGGDAWLREPAVAGRFYPRNARELREEMARCLGPERPGEPARVIVGPHAGTMYSGAVAGALYAQVRVPRRCIVLSPNHSGRGAPFALWPRGAWRTPLGDVPVDEELAAALARACPLLVEDRRAHATEHSLEVHLPFLQTRRPDVTIVPLTLAYVPYDACAAVGRAVAKVVRDAGDDVLIVASTDMSHYISADDARVLDLRALDRVTAVDDRGLYDVVARDRISMCGVIPTTVALAAARALGLRDATLVRYATSGDVTGDASSVVGYASVTIG